MGITLSEKNNQDTEWFVYMLYCGDGSLYTGVTTDLDRRLQEHNEGPLGAKYTRARRPVTIAWHEECESRSSAVIREAEIKKMNREQKLRLVNSLPVAD